MKVYPKIPRYDHPVVPSKFFDAADLTLVEINGYEFRYDDQAIRDILKQFATDADAVDIADVVAYCRRCASPAEE